MLHVSKNIQLPNFQFLISNFITVKIITSKSNLGFAKGNNEAVKHESGKYLLFLNSDIEVLDDAIDKLYNFYIKQTDYQFIGAKLLNKNLTPQASVGPFYSLPYVFIWLFLRGDYWGGSRSSPDRITSADWVSGACFITTKDYYDKLSGFDEKIFMYMDEVDLFYRANKQGLKVGYYPNARFIHLGSASSASRKQPILQVYRGLLYFYKKHHSTLELNILKFLLKLKALIALTIGKATNNQYLITTYEQAYQLTKAD